MNKVFLIGRTTDKPQLKNTPNGVSVATFTIAINRRFNSDQTDFIPVVVWRGLAENCAKYIEKGQQVAVSGELQSRRYEDKDGNKRTAFEVNADDVEFLAKAGQKTELGEQKTELGEPIAPDDERLPWA